MIPLFKSINAYQGGQSSCYDCEDPRDGLVNKYATTKTVDSPLTFIFQNGALSILLWFLPVKADNM